MPSDENRGRVYRKLRSVKRRFILLRAASAVFTLGTIYALYLHSGIFGWLLAGVVAVSVPVLPGIGPVMSVFTLWSGRFVDSCPNCPDVGLRRIKVYVEQCDWCGHDWVKADPVSGENTTHLPDEPGHYEYCSIGCQKAHRNARRGSR